MPSPLACCSRLIWKELDVLQLLLTKAKRGDIIQVTKEIMYVRFIHRKSREP